jgi:hypothetical protein
VEAEVRYCVYKRPSPIPVRSQINPVHGPPFRFKKIHLNIILLSTPGPSKWFLSLGFHHKKPVCASHLPHTSYMPQPITLFTFTRTLFGEVYKSVSSLLCSFLHYPVTSSLLCPDILLSTLFFKHSQPTCHPQCERPSFTPVQNNSQNYIFVYLNFYIFG